jgi:hypothetical protein
MPSFLLIVLVQYVRPFLPVLADLRSLKKRIRIRPKL